MGKQPDEAFQAAADAIREIPGVSRVGIDRIAGQIIFVYDEGTWCLKLWDMSRHVLNAFPVRSRNATGLVLVELCTDELCPNAGRHFKHPPGITEHDRIRWENAILCDRDSLESLTDAIGGLQSTDHPDLVPLHDELLKVFNKLKRQQSIK